MLALALTSCSLYDFGSLAAGADAAGSTGGGSASGGGTTQSDGGLDASCPPQVLATSAFDAGQATSPPALGAQSVDPRSNALTRRVTDLSQIVVSPPTALRTPRSSLGASNADGSRVLLEGSNFELYVFTVTPTGAYTPLRRLSIDGERDLAWHPTDPNILFSLGKAGGGLTLSQTNVATGVTSEARDLTARITALFPQAGVLWQHLSGRPSLDGRTWCLLVEDDAYHALGLVAYDAIADSILGSLPMTRRPTWVSTGALGQRCVAAFNDGTIELRSWPTSFATSTQVMRGYTELGNAAVDVDGREVWVTATQGSLWMNALSDGVGTELVNFGNELVLSASVSVPVGRPGWATVAVESCQTSGGAPCPSSAWFFDQVFAVRLSQTPTTFSIASVTSRCEGCSIAPSTDSSLSRVLWTSDAGQSVTSVPSCWLHD